MEEQILKLGSHIGHPGIIAAFALLIAASVFTLALRAKKIFAAWIVVVGIIVVGIAPFAISRLVHSRDVYHVQIVIVRPDQSTVDIAQVRSSNGGELKLVHGGWELDIPPQDRPQDGKVTLFASVKDEFLTGESTIALAQDHYPSATIQLVAQPSATVRGVVVDEDLVAVVGARVSIAGYPDVAVTDQRGNFALSAHAGRGQIVEVLARKDHLTGKLSTPAGKVVEVILGRD